MHKAKYVTQKNNKKAVKLRLIELKNGSDLTISIVRTLAQEFDLSERRIRQIDKEDFDPKTLPEKDDKRTNSGGKYGNKYQKKNLKKTELLKLLRPLIDKKADINYGEIAQSHDVTIRYIKQLEKSIRDVTEAGVKQYATDPQKVTIYDFLAHIGNITDDKIVNAILDNMSRKQASATIRCLINIKALRYVLEQKFSKNIIVPLLGCTDLRHLNKALKYKKLERGD